MTCTSFLSLFLQGQETEKNEKEISDSVWLLSHMRTRWRLFIKRSNAVLDVLTVALYRFSYRGCRLPLPVRTFPSPFSFTELPLMSSHLLSSHLIWFPSFYFVSSHLISSHLISSLLISSHLISFHLPSPHLISFHFVLFYHLSCLLRYYVIDYILCRTS